MNAKLGIGWRLALIVVLALVLMQLATIVAHMIENRDASRFGLAPLLPDQITALVQIADATPPERRATLATAVSGQGVKVEFLDRFAPETAQGRELPLLERGIRRRLGDRDRMIWAHLARAGADPGPDETRLPNVRVVVALAGGGYLDFAAVGDLAARLFGIPVGFLAGAFGVLVALAALVAIAREARPLVRLAQAVDGLGTDLRGRPLTEEGAPEVRRLVRALNRMQDRIVGLVENRSLLLGAIAHDLGTLMTRLRLRLELLPPDPGRDKAVKDLADMARLVSDSLAFARSSSERDHADLDLAQIVRETTQERIDLGAPVRLAPGTATAEVSGSRLGLSRLVGNLVDNALRHAGDAEVGLAAEGDRWRLTVADHGPGIPEAERGGIFEPFARLDPSRNRATGGSGLGLAIVRQIVEAHEGTIEVGGRADGASGAVFTVRLPKRSGHHRAPAASPRE